MSDFGDFDPDDALDTAPADPEQVARRLHLLRRREGLESVGWDDLYDLDRARRVMLVEALLDWMRRQGAA